MSAEGGPASPFLAAAVEIVRRAGEIQLARLGTGFRVESKGHRDIVTAVDVEVERMFRAVIAERFPDHAAVGEETGGSGRTGARSRWLFDPIDGTVNYAHGIPFFCASLAFEVDGRVEAAAIHDPSRQELFTAERGRGSWLNGRSLDVSSVDRLEDSALGTGFPHGATSRDRPMEDLLGECAVRAQAVRRLGSAALDLCYVACGRTDAFWDRGLKPWDLAAGALIVREAGGTVTALDGGPFSHESGEVLASNGRVHAALVDVVRSVGAMR
jgi:myo-inositol-1(or 4)-monophosphatase